MGFMTGRDGVDQPPIRTAGAWALVVVAWVSVATGCLDVADERAEIDEGVGTASSAGLTVEVADGLAAVRSVDDGEVHLWASAPSLDIAIDHTGETVEEIDLRIDNVLPDAELVGDAVVSELTSGPTTRRSWRVRLPAGARAELRLAAPDADELTPWSFLLFADVQDAVDRVDDIFARMNEEDARFAIIVGDLTEEGSTSELERFQQELSALRMPCFATLGNHELGFGGTHYHRFYGRGTFRFDHRGVRFVLVDSASATVARRARDWVSSWTRGSPHDLVVVGMHVPPQDPVGARSGSFTSRDEASTLLSDLSAAGVDATFYGHVHSYYAFRNAGIPAYISGGGGAIPQRWDGIGRHFLRVDVRPAEERITTALIRVDEDD